MKAFKYILFMVLIFIIGFSVYVAVQPNSFEVERSRTIKAPSAVIYNQILDFKSWPSWSSWAEADPEMTFLYSEKTQGIGASYSWEDDNGTGTMTTISATEPFVINQEMQINDYPKSQVSWELTPKEDGNTDVSWKINGNDLPFGFKAYAILTGGMEKEIGPNYERSLEKLDSIVKADMKRYSISIEGVTQHSGGFYLYTTTSCKFSNFKEKMQEQFPKVGAYALTHNITMAGKPFVIYHKWDEANDAIIFSCAIPTNSRMVADDPEILTGQLESFKAVKTTLNGDYENLKEAWDNTMTFIQNNILKVMDNGPMLEVYLTDPSTTPNPTNWKTELFIAVD